MKKQASRPLTFGDEGSEATLTGLSIVVNLNAERQKLEVVGVELFANDAHVVRRRSYDRTPERKRFWAYDVDGTVFTNDGVRQPITEFSKSARKNLAFVASNTDVIFSRMVTLTYPGEFTNDGRESKRHLNAILQWMRRRGLVDYLWFLEFQKRGAPHYHILIDDFVQIDKIELSQAWFRIVGSGDENHLLAGTRLERGRKERGLHRYAIKYATKMHQKNIPPDFVGVGRLWGCSGSVAPRRRGYIPLDCESSLSSILERWDYVGAEQEGYSVLFGAAKAIREYLQEIGAENAISEDVRSD